MSTRTILLHRTPPLKRLRQTKVQAVFKLLAVLRSCRVRLLYCEVPWDGSCPCTRHISRLHYICSIYVLPKNPTMRTHFFLTSSTYFLKEMLETFHCLLVQIWLPSRAANNFPAGAGQIVRSNLFLLGHTPFLAGQTSITSYCYKSAPSPLHVMFKYETSKFSKHLLYMSIDLNAGKVERMVQQNLYHICAYYYCFSSASYIRLVVKLMKLTEACNLVDFKCYWKQGSSIPKMHD